MASIENKIKPVFFSGIIYYGVTFKVDEDLEETGEFSYEAELKIQRCSLIPNGDNERLKFDITPQKGYFERYFTGFLYPNESVLGKIKYIQDAGVDDDVVNGSYIKTDANEIAIRGIIDDKAGGKTSFYIELEKTTAP